MRSRGLRCITGIKYKVSTGVPGCRQRMSNGACAHVRALATRYKPSSKGLARCRAATLYPIPHTGKGFVRCRAAPSSAAV